MKEKVSTSSPLSSPSSPSSPPPSSSTSASTSVCRHPVTFMALLVTIGIVFGDIGTSPLYVMKVITGINHGINEEYIIGAVSCIIWTLTLQTTLKYVIIALRADNHGEGGILALFALVRKKGPKWLFLLAALGASALVADGVITPAMTVTSAIEGLTALEPEAPVVAIVVVIISVIFFVQRFGTSAIGKFFGPFMLLWFLMLGVLGAVVIPSHPAIFKAFNPYHAIMLVMHYPAWFLILGAVFLCTTGAEALYSDLGHCGRLNISLSWIFVKIMLILNYLGQGAWLIANADSVVIGSNPFYDIMPRWFIPIGIVMSTGAAIIASQALLSGSFTIFSEAMNLRFWPWQRIKYPSSVKGQLFVPWINLVMYVGCMVTVILFRTSAGMEAAYGLAITVTMLMTTVLLAFYLHQKGAPRWLTALFMLFFIVLEGAFFVANVFKFVHGGWYTVLIAGIVCAVMVVWNRASHIRERFMEFADIDKSLGVISDLKADKEVPKYASNLVYISNSTDASKVETKLLYSILNKQPKRADHYWLIRIEYVDDPDTLEYDVTTLIPETLFSIHMRLGFRVQPRVSVYLRQVIEDLVKEGKVDLTSSYPSLHAHGVNGDFRFIIIHRIFSASSSCGSRERWLMQLHNYLRHMSISDEDALGLDTSVVTVETVPLIINNTPSRRIQRIL